MQTRIIAAGLLAAGVMLGIAPTAAAAPVPGPEPVPVPAPPTTESGSATEGGSSSMCQNGEVMQYGNCIPAMAPLSSTVDEAVPEAPLRLTDSHSSTTQSGVPSDLVPNINGTPCTGYWMSVACYAENMGDSAPGVTPRSTLSSSP